MIIRIIFLLCLADISSKATFALTRISLQQALHHPGISLKLKGHSSSKQRAELQVKNGLNQGIELVVHAGQLLHTSHEDAQNLIVTKTQFFALKPGEQMQKPLWAMCIESHDRGPGPNDPFRPVGMASGPLLAMAQTIDKYELHTNAVAQDALWCLSNKHPVSSIYHPDPQITRLLQEQVAQVHGISLDELLKKERLNQPKYNRIFHAIYRFALKQDQSVELRLYDPQGNQVAQLMPETCLAPGVHEIPVGYYRSYPEEGYYQMVLVSNNQVIERKLIRLR